MTFPRTATRSLLAAVLIFLAACSSDKDTPPPTCPKATILEDTANLTRFREGPGRDLIDVNFTGSIEHLNGSCIYVVDSTEAGVLNMDVQIEVRVDRGPANQDRVAKFDYFVTVLDVSGRVMAKEIFPVNIEFNGNKTTSRESDAPVSMVIPVTAAQGSDDFTVFVGFQLSADEIHYNREKIRGGKPQG